MKKKLWAKGKNWWHLGGLGHIKFRLISFLLFLFQQRELAAIPLLLERMNRKGNTHCLKIDLSPLWQSTPPSSILLHTLIKPMEMSASSILFLLESTRLLQYFDLSPLVQKNLICKKKKKKKETGAWLH